MGEVRRSTGRLERDGMVARMFVPDVNPFDAHDDPDGLYGQMREISAEWARHRVGGERGFCAGRFDTTSFPDVWLAIAWAPGDAPRRGVRRMGDGAGAQGLGTGPDAPPLRRAERRHGLWSPKSVQAARERATRCCRFRCRRWRAWARRPTRRRASPPADRDGVDAGRRRPRSDGVEPDSF